MTRRMLIDGNHPEEIRVVILNGNRLEDYDIETSTKTQLKGNIYLAKVTRVEPSLQAAFVDYGGNRHGFLAFSEIHPDYYQIPIEDREALKRDMSQLADNAQAAQAHVEEMDEDVASGPVTIVPVGDAPREGTMAAVTTIERVTDNGAADAAPSTDDDGSDPADSAVSADAEAREVYHDPEQPGTPEERKDTDEAADGGGQGSDPEGGQSVQPGTEQTTTERSDGGRRRRPPRRYRIQEVIKRRQILLVQVVKEERGNKGAALTTYLSLAGRYCVLMPNAARVGGVSRKITSASDRRRLRDLLNSLEVPDGMGVIMRTAGMERTKAEIKRDLDYLLRLWEDVRELTLGSTAPALVYEEGDLIKRAIRDLYARDIEEVLVEGNEAYQTAKKFMRLMMPSHAKRVKQYRDPTIPLFHRYQVESQLEAMHSPVVHLKSGGYIVINPTEALVAIDVNSGRATRERNIEETAVKTNLEAASEIARQLRLRDLAGLIVIDFIDMEENRNQRAVEKRMKESVKTDRARIQLGRISTFGLFELSRQRLRPSLLETSSETCPRCHGVGHVRSTESTAIRVLRALEEEGIRRRTAEVTIDVATPIALYILNQKRSWLADIERRYAFSVKVTGDDTLVPPEMRLERTRARTAADDIEHPLPPPIESPVEEVEAEAEAEDEVLSEERDDASVGEPREAREPREGGRRRRRRRRRKDGGGEPRDAAPGSTVDIVSEAPEAAATAPETPHAHERAPRADGGQEEQRARRRRRGRRGGRRRRGEQGDEAARTAQDAGAASPVSADEAQDMNAEPGGEQQHIWPQPPDVTEVASARPKPEAEAEPAPEPVASTVPEPAPAAAEVSHGNGGSAPPEPVSPAEPSAAPEEEPPDAPKTPPRRGWWQRMTESR